MNINLNESDVIAIKECSLSKWSIIAMIFSIIAITIISKVFQMNGYYEAYEISKSSTTAIIAIFSFRFYLMIKFKSIISKVNIKEKSV